MKKIGGYGDKSYIQRVDPEEVSHMLFAGGTSRLTSWFATHPPLIERINALDPAFTEDHYPAIDLRVRDSAARSDSVAGFSDAASARLSGIQSISVSGLIADSVGAPEPRHVMYAQKLRSSIPAALYAAAHEPDEALLLAIALSLGESRDHNVQQLTTIEEQIGAERADVVRQYLGLIMKAGPVYRLPLLEIAFPVLRKRPVQQIEFLLELVRKLIQLDSKVDLSEYCYYRILAGHLKQAVNPTASRGGNRVRKKTARQAAVHLMRIVAEQGNGSPEAAQKAFEAGTAQFGQWAGEQDDFISTAETVAVLDKSLDILSGMNTAGRQSLIQAVSETITHDGKLILAEAELLRAICATLDCPLPPILAEIPDDS